MQPPEYLYPLSGGLMLGSCVYHLLYFNGDVLGISGIYGSAISRAVSLVGLKLGRISTPGKKATADTPANGKVHRHNDTAADDVGASDPLLADGSSSPVKKDIVLEDGNWQIAFTLGLLAAGVLLRAIRPYLERSLGSPIFDQSLASESSKWLTLSLFVVGLLIGVGTRMSNGCTAGHMLCGMSRLSLRSTVATATFFAAAVLVHFLNPSPSSPPILPERFDALTVLLFQIPFLFYRFIIPRLAPGKWYQYLSSFAIAVHFALGLALAGMLQPSKILNFLSLPLSPNFDPSLAFVAIGGLGPNILVWTTKLRSFTKTGNPLFGTEFHLPSNHDIDWKLIVGSVIFGVGWGWSGICPGPGIVLEGAFADRWRSIGAWFLGMSIGRLVTP